MSDHSKCVSSDCGYWEDGSLSACPKCGGAMRVTKGSTARGWVLLMLGLFLILLMGTITASLAPTMLNAGKEIDGSTFEGTPEQARIFLGLFALVIVFGFVSTVYGLFQIVTRRESKAFILVSLLLAVALAAVGFYILYAMK